MQELSRTTPSHGWSSIALLEMSIVGEVEHVAEVRHGVTSVLEAIGQEAVAPDAALVVSELLTNAVTYADSTVRISMYAFGSAVRIEVCDDGQGHPEMVRVDADVPEGRGLCIVDHLASRWGVDESGAVGKTVWCELTLPPEPASAPGTGAVAVAVAEAG